MGEEEKEEQAKGMPRAAPQGAATPGLGPLC